MKLKLDENGHIVVKDGQPVYIHNDGKELPFDAASTVNAIARLNSEAKGHRERAEAAEAKLKGFEGIDDPDAAKKALETVINLDAGKLVQAGKVEEIKAAAQKAAQEQLAAANKTHATEMQKVKEERDALANQLHSEMIGGSFSRSKFISEKAAIPADLVQAKFGKHFKISNGKIVAVDANGTEIFSRTRHGEVADFDEALETLIDQYPHKDQILKGRMAAGGGAQNNGNQGTGGKKTMTRAQFNALDAASKLSFVTKEGGAVVDAA